MPGCRRRGRSRPAPSRRGSGTAGPSACASTQGRRVHRHHKDKARLPVINRNTVDLLAQVAIQVANEGFHDLPLVVFHFGSDFSDQEATGSIAPLYPTGVLDMLPPPLLFPLECRVRATQLTLRGFQKGFQFGVDSCLGNDLQDFHVAPFFLFVACSLGFASTRSFAISSISPRSKSPLAPQPFLPAGMSGRKRS